MSNTEEKQLQKRLLTRAQGENSVYIPGKHILDPKVRTSYLLNLKYAFENNRVYSLQIHYVLQELAKLKEYSDEIEEMQAQLQECVVMSKLFRKHLGETSRKRLYDYLHLLLKVHYQADGVMAALQLFGYGGDDTELFVKIVE